MLVNPSHELPLSYRQGHSAFLASWYKTYVEVCVDPQKCGVSQELNSGCGSAGKHTPLTPAAPRTSLSSRRPALRSFSCTFHTNMATQDTKNTHLECSTRILETLDPCVVRVLMKTMIADHATSTVWHKESSTGNHLILSTKPFYVH
jgi:hypothetical protein